MSRRSKKAKTSQSNNHNWSEFHEDLLLTIAKKLITVEDFRSFVRVCRSWRSIARNKHLLPMFSKPSFPWLMLTVNDDNDNRRFYSPSQNKFRSVKLPEARDCECWGSPFGWLVTYRQPKAIHLLNLVSRARIQLPKKVDIISKLDRNPLQYMYKAAIISITESYNGEKLKYLVFAIIGLTKQLVFAREGADTWTTTIRSNSYQEDLIHFNGSWYTVDWAGRLSNFNIDPLCPVASSFSQSERLIQEQDRCYLVEFDKELHMVVRIWKFVPGYATLVKTEQLQVYKFDEKMRKWERVYSLGDNVVFVGRNTSFALQASDYPCCKADCIYFTDAYRHAYPSKDVVANDMGIFNMKTSTMETLCNSEGLLTPAVWITPMIW